jgi:hypothetical protein
MHLKTWGLNYRTDLIDPHATTMDAAKISACNWVTMVVDREVAGEEVAAKGTLLMEGVMRTIGLTMI